MRGLHETGLAEEQREETSRLDWEAVEEKKVSFRKNFFSLCSFRIQSIILKYV